MERDKQDNERLGYSLGFGFTEQAASINPVVQYEITDKISCNANFTLSTDDKVQVALGCDYAIAKDKKISVNYVENYEQRRLQDTMVVIGYAHQGYQFRVPILTFTQEGNPWGMAMTLSVALAANLGAYACLKVKQRKPMLERKEFAVAWSAYEQGLTKVENYIRENNIFLERSMKLEGNNKGLEIIEAYYGLDEHIL